MLVTSSREILPYQFSLEDHLAQGFLFALRVLLLLVPPPLVDLGLRQASDVRHLHDLVLGPVGLNIQLLFEHLDLTSALALPLLDSILGGLFLDFLIEMRFGVYI